MATRGDGGALASADEGGDQRSWFPSENPLAKLGAPAGKELCCCVLLIRIAIRGAASGGTGTFGSGEDRAKTLLATRLGQVNRPTQTRVDILSHKALLGDGKAKTQLVQFCQRATEPAAPAPGGADIGVVGDDRARNLLSDVAVQPGNLQVAAARALCLIEDPSGQPVLRTTLWQTGAGMPPAALGGARHPDTAATNRTQ